MRRSGHAARVLSPRPAVLPRGWPLGRRPDGSPPGLQSSTSPPVSTFVHPPAGVSPTQILRCFSSDAGMPWSVEGIDISTPLLPCSRTVVMGDAEGLWIAIHPLARACAADEYHRCGGASVLTRGPTHVWGVPLPARAECRGVLSMHHLIAHQPAGCHWTRIGSASVLMRQSQG